MPFKLLERLCCEELPLGVADKDDIDQLAMLKAAELIEADIPQKQPGQDTYVGHAIVMRVTPAGMAAMKRGTTRLPGGSS